MVASSQARAVPVLVGAQRGRVEVDVHRSVGRGGLEQRVRGGVVPEAAQRQLYVSQADHVFLVGVTERGDLNLLGGLVQRPLAETNDAAGGCAASVSDVGDCLPACVPCHAWGGSFSGIKKPASAAGSGGDWCRPRRG